ncbi:MAG: hypothetical protein AABX00_03180 [Nanoarchaeota archaeon]
MSAEKEIVNHWYNKKGYFTISNLKANNRDLGILAFKPDTNDIIHVQVSCSLTGAFESKENVSAEKISEEKFYEDSIAAAIQKNMPMHDSKNWKRVLVLSSLPKSRKESIVKEFRMMEVEVVEFENILYETFEQLDTHYYKNDIIRTLQLTKFILLNDSAKLTKMLMKGNSNSRKELVSTMLDEKGIMKEFRKTNAERLGSILKNSGIKPAELAHMIEHSVLNNRTRKTFMSSLNEQEKIKKVVGKIISKKKKEMSLEKFL